MGSSYIVRKGGKAVERTAVPSINFISAATTSLTFTFTNNEAVEVDLYYGLTTPPQTKITLAGNGTSSNVTFSGLNDTETFNVYAYAIVTDPTTKKIKSEIAETQAKTLIPTPTITQISKTETSITFTVQNNSRVAADVIYGLTSPPTTTTLSLAANTTSTDQTISDLTPGQTVTVFAQAKVEGITDSAIASSSVTTDIVFTEATGGTTLEYNSDGKRYRSHTFTSNGNFVVTTVGDTVDGRNKLDYLIIAGGGGGGGSCCNSLSGGGGGAGGYFTTVGTSGRNTAARPQVNANVQTYSISVGGGGSSSTGAGTNGGDSSALGITASGGGFGGGVGGGGGNGGSGGGTSGNQNSGVNIFAGTGLADQGFNGGLGFGNVGANSCSGGPGGGAGSQPGNNGTGVFDAGSIAAPGAGLNNIIRTGSNENRAKGGEGNTANNAVAKPAGAANTGNGGGASGNGSKSGTAGGSGIVVIRYQIAPA